MINILIISGDERVIKLVDQLQPQVVARINVVGDFDLGLKEVFNKRPSVVFIQSNMSGVSGETVSRHVKGLLREASPKIILMREHPAPQQPLNACFDDSINLFLPDQQLMEAFRKQLDKIPGWQWKEPFISAGPLKATEAKEAGAAEEPSDTSQPQAALPHPPPLKPVVPQPLPAEKQKLQAARVAEAPAITGRPATAGKTPAVSSGPGFVTGRGEAAEPGFTPGRTKSRKPWLYIIAFFVTLGLGFAIYSSAPELFPDSRQLKANLPVPSSSANPPPRVPPGTSQLPTFIPAQSNDVAYANANPGWSRYRTADQEFLVFRENGAIKAVQIIAVREGAITEDFFHSALRELCGSTAFNAKTSEGKGDYLVEKGVVGGNAEAAVYKKRGTGVIRALVISFPG
jgi:CheY-like chemotaxis protein